MTEYKIEVVEKEAELLAGKVMESLMIIRNGNMPNDDAYLNLLDTVSKNVKGLLYGALVDIARAEIDKAFRFDQ